MEATEWLAATGDKDARSRFAERQIPLVKRVAYATRSRYPARAGIDLEDCESIGFLALLAAIDGYDPERNVSFEFYAALRIRGAIIDAFRNLSPAYNPRMKCRAITVLVGDKLECVDHRTDAEASEVLERTESCLDTLGQLDELSRLVLEEMFYRDRTCEDIAAELGISRGRVYSARRRGLKELKNRLHCVRTGHADY